MSAAPDNTTIAARLDRVADLLEAVGANSFRVASYRRAARHARAWERSATTEYRALLAQRAA